MRTLASIVGAAALLAGALAPSSARADASAWAFVGAGAMGWKQVPIPSYAPAGTMILEGGVGTTPEAPVIVGGVFRFQPMMPRDGIDLSFLMRLATQGFQQGPFGVAVDLGWFARPWGFKSIGFSGSVSIGLPFGVTLMGLTEAGIDHAFAFGGVAGVDFLRMTVYRRSGLKWWQNPSAAGTVTGSRGLFAF